MLNHKSEQNKSRLFLFLIMGGLLLVGVGVGLISEAFAVNSTAINEIQSDLADELTFNNSFSVFWIIFLLTLNGVFMACMFIMKEDKETVFFSISALIIALVLSIIWLSPYDFDYQTNTKEVIVEEITYQAGAPTYNSQVKDNTLQIIIIPADSDFRLIMSAIFIGVALFNALYSIYILTDFKIKRMSN